MPSGKQVSRQSSYSETYMQVSRWTGIQASRETYKQAGGGRQICRHGDMQAVQSQAGC